MEKSMTRKSGLINGRMGILLIVAGMGENGIRGTLLYLGHHDSRRSVPLPLASPPLGVVEFLGA